MEMIKNYIKLLELDERMKIDRNDWRRKMNIWIKYKPFYVLVQIINPKLIGIKTC